jgi:hypothetical protein
MPHRIAEARAILVILLAFVLVGLLLPVGAEAPIGDAWSYAWSARQLAEHGTLRLTGFQAMSLIGQLWLTWPFAWAFSAEPAVLNAVTFGFSALTACLFFGLLRAAGASQALAALGVAVLVANPTYLAESLTYDTEIYFLFVGLLGSLAFARWLQNGASALLWLSGAAFAEAVLIRQHAIVFPLAALFALWWSRGERRGRLGLAPAAALALTPLALLGFYAWLQLEHGLPRAFAWQQAELRARLTHPAVFLAYSLNGGLISLHYLALFVAPLLPVLVLGEAPRRHRPRAYAAAAVVVAVGTGLLWLSGRRMPYLPLGSLDRILEPLEVLVSGSTLTRALTGFTALLSFVLIGELSSRGLALRSARVPPSARAAIIAFCSATAALLLGISVTTGLRFERYLLLPLPFLIAVLLGQRAPRAAMACGWLVLAPALGLSLHFVDQRVRATRCEWETARQAVELGYAPFSIDAGFAFNGYYSYERLQRLYAPDSIVPWSPERHPRARILVRPLLFADAADELLQSHVCANRPGLPDLAYGIFRKVD